MISKSSLSIEKVAGISVLTIAFLAPLVVLPIVPGLIEQGKYFLGFVGAVMLVASFVLSTFKHRRWQMVLSPFLAPLIAFGLVALSSSFFTNEYPQEALLGSGGMYIAFALIAIFGGTLMEREQAKKFVPTLAISGAVLGLVTLLQTIGWGPSQLLNALFKFSLPHSVVFNPAGTPFDAMLVMGVLLVGVIARVILRRKLGTLEAISLPLMLIGLAITTWSILPGREAAITLPPLSAGWSIALDTLRNPGSALIGQGPESYTNVFRALKPNWINSKEYWQFNFGSASNFPLTSIVTLGILGLASWSWLTGVAVKQMQKAKSRQLAATWVIAATFALQLLFPTNYVILLLQAVAIAVWISMRRDDLPTLYLKALAIHAQPADQSVLKKPDQSNRFGYLITAIILLAGVGYSGYQGYRAFATYNHLYKANLALLSNDAVATYEEQRRSVLLSPQLDTLRRQFALTNLQIAIILSNKADATQEDRAQVVQLVSAALQEARAATVIDAKDTQNWVTLGEVYRNLIGSADQAEQWAVDAYVSAIQTNPSNPLLRIELGKLFMNKKQYQDAIGFFTQAVQLKPDLPTGYFHLGQALVANNQFTEGQNAWQQTLLLLTPETEDYKVVETALGELQKTIEASGSGKQAAQNPAGQPGSEVSPLGEEAQRQQLNTEGSELPAITEQNVENSDKQVVNEPSAQPLTENTEDKLAQ